jgi:hypothetical protein
MARIVTTAMALSEHASREDRRWLTSRYASEMCFNAAAELIRGPQRLLLVKDEEIARRQWKSCNID